MTSPGIELFETSSGAKVYQLPLEAFPGFWGYAYLVFVGEYRVLIDAGSGFAGSNEHLESGLKQAGLLAAQAGLDLPQPFTFDGLTHILITHAHIDHIGGLAYIMPRTQAKLGIHELDRRNLTSYEERQVVTSRRLSAFLVEAGVTPDLLERLLGMYKMTKSLFHSVPVDFTFEAAGMRLGPFEMLHVPGHCAGHVVIRLDDILFSGDHILNGTSPHQAPERLTLSTGLDHYLKSLDALDAWASGVRLALGGHKAPITDLHGRAEEIRSLHQERLKAVLAGLAEPHTIAEISAALFGEVHGYNELLALEEAGAHVEYLYQRGQLEITNLADLAECEGPMPVVYRRILG